LDFRLSQGNVATYYRLGGNLCDTYIENFLTNQTSRGLVFLEHGVYIAP